MICDERRDEWSAEVRGRIKSVNDLHAADAVYHQSCIVAGITPGGFADNAVIKRYHVTIDDLKSVGKIGLTYYKAPIIHVSTSELKFIRLEDFSVNDHTYILDIFLQIAWPLKTPTPGWSGV